jgi:hypothetical protein
VGPDTPTDLLQSQQEACQGGAPAAAAAPLGALLPLLLLPLLLLPLLLLAQEEPHSHSLLLLMRLLPAAAAAAASQFQQQLRPVTALALWPMPAALLRYCPAPHAPMHVWQREWKSSSSSSSSSTMRRGSAVSKRLPQLVAHAGSASALLSRPRSSCTWM